MRKAEHALGPPTMNSLQGSLEADRSNEPPSHGKPVMMPCKIEDSKIMLMSAHDYFCLKLGKLPAVGLDTPQGTSNFGRDATFFQTVTSEYILLEVCHSSRTAFTQLTMDRFFDLDSLCRAILTQGQAKVAKMNASATSVSINSNQSI